jgi:WD40-like Beta Propeller Repeat
MSSSRVLAQLPPAVRVSTTSAGAQANGLSERASISADGRFVAFESSADNLVPNDTNNRSDIFVKDRQTGAVERVSVRSDGSEATDGSTNPSISADGRFVTFTSFASLTALPPNQNCGGLFTCPDVYVHDRTTGETTLITVAPDGTTHANSVSNAPSISGDGRYIVFTSGASNLGAGPGGQPSGEHLYLRDRMTGTLTWLDRAANGAASFATPPAIISADGSTILFLSVTRDLDPTPDPLPCAPGDMNCERLYVVDRASGAISRVPITDGIIDTSSSAFRGVSFGSNPALSADGRTIAFLAVSHTLTPAEGDKFTQLELVYDRTTGHTRLLGTFVSGFLGFDARAAIDATGRVAAFSEAVMPTNPNLAYIHAVDTISGLLVVFFGSRNGLATCSGLSVGAGGNVIAFSTSQADLVPGDTNDADDVFVLDLDTDHDGMPDDWERQYGLNPTDPADAALDPDGDGKTNLQEYQAGTNPKGTFTRYFAEGAANSFFRTEIVLYNPNSTNATVLLRFLGDHGGVVTQFWTLLPQEQVNALLPSVPDPSFSTVIESDLPVAAERTMYWGGPPSYGSHSETAIAAPSSTWYFAEGATHGSFDLFYLLQNPGDASATATITYLLPGGQPPIVRDYAIAPHSRRTIYVDQEPGLSATDVSAKIVSDVPILAERSMYLSTPDQPFAGGTGGAGIPQPGTHWFVAEGATGTFFDLYLLIGNPSASDAAVTVTYLLENGTSFDKPYVVAKESRLTIDVKHEDPRLAATSVSSAVTSTNAVPIVVERAMWWPSPAWYEGHLTAATNETATTWVLADGRVGTAFDRNTYVLVANPGDTVARVTFTLAGHFSDGSSSQPIGCPLTVDVGPHSRYTADLKALCGVDHLVAIGGGSVAGTISSDGPGIVVERSTYESDGTQFWAAGSSTLLTKLPPSP